MRLRRRSCSAPFRSLPGRRFARIPNSRRLEQSRHTRDLQGVRLIGPWFLRAETWPRKNLIGVRQSLRVEGTSNALHGIEVGLGEHYRHELFLLLPHAVLAGDRAAGFHAQS